MSALSATRWVSYGPRTPSAAASGPLAVTAHVWNPERCQPPSSSRTLRAARHPALARYAYVQARRRRGPPHTEGAPRDPRSKPDTAAGPLALASTHEWHALYGHGGSAATASSASSNARTAKTAKGSLASSARAGSPSAAAHLAPRSSCRGRSPGRRPVGGRLASCVRSLCPRLWCLCVCFVPIALLIYRWQETRP